MLKGLSDPFYFYGYFLDIYEYNKNHTHELNEIV